MAPPPSKIPRAVDNILYSGVQALYSGVQAIATGCLVLIMGTALVSSSIISPSRKPYARYLGDSQFRFQRVLTNEDELIFSLNSSFPSLQLTVLHMESLPICSQIHYAHEADILVGVHGAGLSHLWWLRDKAFIFELVPKFKLDTPTFKMLANLAGRRHHGITISGNNRRVMANLTEVIERLKNVSDFDLTMP